MTRLPVKVDIAFNAGYATAASARTYTDVTAYVLTANGININHGRQNELTTAGANTCSLTLDNRDGRFSPGLASSPYYPNVKIGRPIRVSVNLCTAGDNGTFEDNATDWSGSNATVARSTAAFKYGAASLSVTSSAAGDMDARTLSGTSGFPVDPSTVYVASCWVRRAAGGTPSLTADLRVDWYDSGGASISTDVSSSLADTITFQLLSATLTAPSNAAYARVRPRWASATAAGEVHYVDDVRLDSIRYDGYVDEWPVEWPATVSTWATSTITATSRSARLGLSDKLHSVVEEEILTDSPAAYYTFGESEGSTRANDSSGNQAAQLVATTLTTTSAHQTLAPVFGSATGPETDSLTAVEFPWVASVSNSQVLRARPTLSTLDAVEFFMSRTGTFAADRRLVIIHQGSTGSSVIISVDATGFIRADIDASSVSSSAALAVDTLQHIALRKNGANVDLYIGGALDGSVAATLPSYDVVTVGGNDDPPGATNDITLAHLALYSTAPSAARILAHADAGLNGFTTETAATRLARYAGYAGIPAAEYSFAAAATTPMAHIDTTGKTPIELMQTAATTDGGVLYDAPDGTLTYQARSARYNATAVLTLDASAGEVRVGYSPKLDRSALVNKVTAANSAGTYSVTAENTTSSDDYGTHSPGDLELATTDDNEVHAAAWWRVNTYSEPSARAPQLSVGGRESGIASLSAARQAAVLAVKVGDKITVTNLPSQSDASSKSFFCEGYTETITDSAHFIEFNVSPTTGFDVWVVEDATYGAYDSNPLAY